MNYGLAKVRLDIAHVVVAGLQRLEYRGYDSAGLAADGVEGAIVVFKEVGPVSNLLSLVNQQTNDPVRNLALHAHVHHCLSS